MHITLFLRGVIYEQASRVGRIDRSSDWAAQGIQR